MATEPLNDLENQMSRREQLESMLADDPSDTFLRYALAMELKNEEAFPEAAELFNGLMQDGTPYVPAFFMYGQQLVQEGEIEQAQTILKQGIEQAHQQNDLHAAGEMSEFLASISD